MSDERIAEIRSRIEDVQAHPGDGTIYTTFIARCEKDVPYLLTELAAAEAERDRLRAALATLTNVAERTVTDLLLDGTAPGTLGAITRLDISVIEARAALAGSTAGGRAMPEPKVLAALQAAGAALAGTYALLTRAGDQEGAAHCMRVIEQLDEALGSFNRAPDVLRCSAYTQVARRAWNHDGRSPKE